MSFLLNGVTKAVDSKRRRVSSFLGVRNNWRSARAGFIRLVYGFLIWFFISDVRVVVVRSFGSFKRFTLLLKMFGIGCRKL